MTPEQRAELRDWTELRALAEHATRIDGRRLRLRPTTVLALLDAHDALTEQVARLTTERDTQRDALSNGMDSAWMKLLYVMPDDWMPPTLSPTDPSSFGYDGKPWCASTCSRSFWSGESDRDEDMAQATGDSPIEALQALRAALTSAGSAEPDRCTCSAMGQQVFVDSACPVHGEAGSAEQ